MKTAPESGGTEWIGRRQIARTDGALKPAAYVARAYRHAYEHGGVPPEWARKEPSGRWLFRRDYVEKDAAANRGCMSVGDTAKLLNVSRRTIQVWIDCGVVPTYGGAARGRGEERRIPKREFLALVPKLKKRLETPAVVGYRLRHGRQVAAEVIERIELGRNLKALAPGSRRRARRRQAGGARAVPTPAELEAELAKTQAAKAQATRERKAAEREARIAAAAEDRAASSLARRAAAAKKELRAVREAGRSAEAERKAATKAAREMAAQERKTAAAEARLHAQLEEQRNMERKTRIVALEVQLQRARKEQQLKSRTAEQRAEKIAEKIANDMFDGKLDRIDAIVLFNESAEEQGVPREMQLRVRKRVFGR